MKIRPIENSDWPATWRIIEPVFRSGETYAFPTDITEDEARRVWVELPLATFVAVDDDNEIVGTYYLKASQLGNNKIIIEVVDEATSPPVPGLVASSTTVAPVKHVPFLGPGSHVCNCGYIASEKARGKGVASAMCEHSQREAIDRRFRSMQYNLVAATNEGAVHLWKKLGFKVVGTLPKAFRHPQAGLVDAFVMFKEPKVG